MSAVATDSIPWQREEWSVVRFGEVVRQVKDTVDPETSGLARYVAGEHMRTDDLRIRSWGTVGDGYLGPAFHRRFRRGQTLYGSRRTYLRKVAQADFDGICANTTFVCEPADRRLSGELLPYVMQTEAFHAHSIGASKGSVNPYVNWSDLAVFEFRLPPTDVQETMVAVLQGADQALWRWGNVEAASARASEVLRLDLVATAERLGPRTRLGAMLDPERPVCYGVVQPGDNVDDGVPLVRVCDIEDGAAPVSELRRISHEVHDEYRRSVLVEGDVLVSVVGTIGRVVVVPPDWTGFNIARAVARLAPNTTKVSSRFLEALLLAPQVQARLLGESRETARKTLNLKELAELQLPLPDRSQQEQLLTPLAKCHALLAAAAQQRAVAASVRTGVLNEMLGA